MADRRSALVIAPKAHYLIGRHPSNLVVLQVVKQSVVCLLHVELTLFTSPTLRRTNGPQNTNDGTDAGMSRELH